MRNGLIILGLLGMIGEATGFRNLSAIYPDWVTMKFTTGFSFFLVGISLYFKKESLYRKIPFLKINIIMIEQFISNSLEKTSVFDLFGVDAIQSVLVGRPSVGTMCMFFVSTFILCFDFGKRKHFILSAFIVFIGFAAILGYVYNLPKLYFREDWSTGMAFLTALGFILIGFESLGETKKNDVK